MSTILKALKKLEQDKLKKGQGQSEIAYDILKASPRSRRSRVLPTAMSVGAIAIVAGLAFYMLTAIGHNAETVIPQPPPTVAGKIPAAGGEEGTSSIAATPIAADGETGSGMLVEEIVSDSAKINREAERPTAETENGSDIVADSLWTVSGIAWQDKEEQRLAVINGLPVMTGTVIDGATVTAIEEDRVTLSYLGENLTVLLPLPEGD